MEHADNLVTAFNAYRSKMNDRILASKNKTIQKIYNTDAGAYKTGVLDEKTKEMLGLVASLVLRCDDCVKYHTQTCFELGLSEDAFFEILGIGNLVGGSIVIPHTRRAVEFWDALKMNNDVLHKVP